MKTTALIIITACTLVSSAAMAEVGTTASAQASASASASASAQADAANSFDVAQNRTYLDVIASLEAEGYKINDVRTTWLGRIKVMAQSTLNLREVVVSRATGEIMSDIIHEVYANGAANGTAAVATAKNGGSAGVETTLEGGVETTLEAGVETTLEAGVDIGVELGSSGSGASGSGSGGVSIGIGLGN